MKGKVLIYSQYESLRYTENIHRGLKKKIDKKHHHTDMKEQRQFRLKQWFGELLRIENNNNDQITSILIFGLTNLMMMMVNIWLFDSP